MLGTFFPRQQLIKLCCLKTSLRLQLLCGSSCFYSTNSPCEKLKPKQSLQNLQCAKFLSTTVLRDSAMQRVKEKLSFMTAKTRHKMAAYLLYETIADSLDYEGFVKYFQLPDTFQSWFLLIQLHVWMCITLTISEKKGRIYRNSLVESMWQDVEFRVYKIGDMESSQRKKYLSLMSDQFQACLISYDEGILSNDMVLAAAAWRTLFNFQEVNPKLLESMVLYIRKQMYHLDSLNLEDIMNRGSISFLPLKDILQLVENEKDI